MIKYKNMSRIDYGRCLEDMNGEMNLNVFENLHNILDGTNGTHEDTYSGRVVNPRMDCHREFFEDKKRFFTSLIPRLVEKLEPTTLSEGNRFELKKMMEAADKAHNMIKLVWVAEYLLLLIKTKQHK